MSPRSLILSLVLLVGMAEQITARAFYGVYCQEQRKDTQIEISPSTNQLMCTATANAGPDQTICAPGGNVQLNGSFSGNVLSWEWTPPAGLNDPLSLTPTAFITTTTTYTFSVFAEDPNAPNLVLNGDFSAGNVGFSSDYLFVPDDPGSNMELLPEGTYSVVTNPNFLHPDFAPCPDHTGGGNMMVINGAAALQSVWCQTINITPGTNYNFSAWLASVHPSSPAQIQFSINGIPIGNIANAPSSTCNWIPFNATWNSGGSATAEICILNLNTQPSGNDFAIDDIVFTEVCEDMDEVTIFVLDPEAVIAPPSLINCNSDDVCQILDGSLSTAGPDVTYNWMASGGGTIISGGDTPTPFVCGAGTYELTVSQTLNGVTCTAMASVTVENNNVPPPPPAIHPETMMPCADSLATFCVTEEDSYETYLWSVPPGVTIISGQGTNCVVLLFSEGSTGDICVVVENFCGIPASACEQFFTQDGPVPIDVLGDDLICSGFSAYEVSPFDPLSSTVAWSIPGDAILVSGQGGQEIVVDWTGSLGGQVCVETSTDCWTTTSCLDVMILAPDTTYADTTLCLGDSILLAGTYQFADGIFLDTFPRPQSCDSLVETTLTFLLPDTTHVPLLTCAIDSVGSDTLYFSNGTSCDSVVIVNRTFVGSDPIFTSASSCFPADTGLVTIVHTNQFGCDSIEYLHTALLPSSEELQSSITCDIGLAGRDTFVFSNQFNCDSIVIVEQQFVPSDTLYNTITTCDSTQVGIDTVVTPVPGACFEVEINETIYVGSDPIFTFAESCFPADTGLVIINHVNQGGCDSIEYFYTELLPSTQRDSLAFTCNQSEEGIDTLLLQNQYNCDSLLIITTEFVSSDTLFSQVPTCDSLLAGIDTLVTPINGGCFLVEIVTTSFYPSSQKDSLSFTCSQSEAGIDTLLLQNQYNCDSLLIITTEFVSSDTVYSQIPTCDSLEIGIDTMISMVPGACFLIEIVTTTLQPVSQKDSLTFTCNQSEVGIDTLLLLNQYNCDSLLIITTEFVNSDTLFSQVLTCDSLAAGIDTSVTVIAGACFLVEVITTIYEAVDPAYAFATSCFPIDTGLTTIIHLSYLGCDSLEFLYTSLSPTTQQDSLAYTCDQSTAGIDTFIFQNQYNCDSLLVITTEYVSSDTIYSTLLSCDATAVGMDTIVTPIQGGCFQVEVVSTIYVGSPVQDSLQFTCFIAEAGVDTVVLLNQNNCDSIWIVTTEFISSDTIYSTVYTCDSMSAGMVDTLVSTVNGGCFLVDIISQLYGGTAPDTLYTTTCNAGEEGILVVTESNQYGCDSTIVTVTDLIVNDTIFQSFPTCEIGNVGIFITTVMITPPCPTVEITEYFYAGSDPTNITDFTCEISQTGIDTLVFPNQWLCDSLLIITTEFVPSDTFYVASNTCDISMAGMDTSVVSIPNACFEVTITTTTYVGNDPIFTFASSCAPQDTGLQIITHLNQYGCDSLEYLQIALLPSSFEQQQASTCDPLEVGVETFTFINQFGCDSLIELTTTLLDPNLCGIEALVIPDPITCLETEGSFSLELILGEAPFTYEWEGPGLNPLGSGNIDSLAKEVIVDGLVAGDYSVTVTSSGGLTTVLTFTLEQEAPVVGEATVLGDFAPYDLPCHGSSEGSARADALSGGLPPYSYEWSHGSLSQEVNDLSAGSYQVSIYDSQGCLDVDTIDLREPLPLEIDLTLADPLCFGSSDGFIDVAIASGGVSPYQYAISGREYQTDTYFGGLSSGVYEVEILDANGCIERDIVAINTPVPVIVELGQDLTIDLGDSTQLQAVFNLPFEALDSIVWNEGLCEACTDPFVTPVVTTAYSIQIADQNGCAATDDIRVFVRKDRGIYFPNGFSPNDDGNNDFFFPFAGPGVEQIVQLEIFDRWGEKVYQQSNFPASDPAFGWDGFFRGEAMNPAVFVWWAKVAFIDGEEVIFSGDVTLVR